MSIYYLDSSAIVKSYIVEVGTPWVRSLIEPGHGHSLYIARIVGAETVSALIRRSKRPGLTPSQARNAVRSFREDYATRFACIEITDSLIARAMDITEVHGLRGYDAVHLAAAIELQEQARASSSPTITFVGADAELNAAALAEGLIVDNPDSHP